MVTAIGDSDMQAHVFVANSPDFADLLPTTWSELSDQGLVVPRHVIGQAQWQLTPTGWLEGIRLSGTLESDECRERCIILIKALKAVIDGQRDVPLDRSVDHWSLAAATSLPMGWIFNAIRSELLSVVFPGRRLNAYWDSGGRSFRVPPTFGMT